MPDPSTHEDLRLIEKTLTYGPHWPAATDALARLSARLAKLEAVAEAVRFVKSDARVFPALIRLDSLFQAFADLDGQDETTP